MYALALAALMGVASESRACSSFRITAKDGTVLSNRTMEFGYEPGYGLLAVPRGLKMASPSPAEGKTGLEWSVSYNYFGVSVFNNPDMMVDGMNEEGLSVSGLWFEPDTKWPEVKPADHKKALAHTVLISWLLGNCKDVADIKAKLQGVKVFGLFIPQMKMAAPLHFQADDASGGSVVIEAEDGELRIYDNPIGILTNAPDFPFMLRNLRNYIGMKNEVVDKQTFGTTVLLPTGHGSGMFGLPGDLTPPSRFVRLAVQIHWADQAADGAALLNQAEHLANSVDIVRGMAVDRNAKGDVISSETTQWTAFKDLTNKIWYYRTYDNLQLRKVDLKALDFSGGKRKQAAIYGMPEAIADMTEQLN